MLRTVPLDLPPTAKDLPDERQLVFRCAVAVVALTFVLVFAGALVTSTNSGMAFSTWPDADGALLVPQRRDAKGLLEHGHRLLGAVVGVLTILLLLLIHLFDRRPAMYLLGAGLLGLVVVQGLLGGYRVLLDERFPTLFPILHGGLAHIVFGVGGFLAFRASTGWLSRAVEEARAVRTARRLAWIALVAMYVQILLGVVVRHADSAHAKWTHVGFAIVTSLLALIAASYSAGRFRKVVGFVRLHRIYMLVLLAQIVLGLVALAVRRPKHLSDTDQLGRATMVSLHVVCGGVLFLLTGLLLARAYRNLVPRGRGVTASRLAAYIELGKLRLSALAVFAVLAGLLLGAPELPDVGLLLATLAGAALVAVGGNALNMLLERDTDPLMDRTVARPLPTGRLSAAEVLVFGSVAAAAGVAVLAAFTNLVAAGLCAATCATYVLVYTPMKRRSTLNTLVGAVPGALPPVVGYAAGAGTVDGRAAVMFLILFLWQIPHFLAIAWRYREDYRRAGLRMLPVDDPDGRRTGLQMVVYGISLFAVSLLPSLPFFARADTGSLTMTGDVYLSISVGLGVLFLVTIVRAAVARTPAAMKACFLMSIVYLPVLFTVMVMDKLMLAAI